MGARKKPQPQGMTGQDWADLLYKIDSEGGLDSYFRGYTSPESCSDPKLRELATRFAEAGEALAAFLQEKADEFGHLMEEYD